jgi:hypothetical protein
MEEIVKYILVGLLAMPFTALIADALGKTDGIMPIVVIGVAALSTILAFWVGSLHQRPNVASIFDWAFIAWPVLLLVAKGINPTISWRAIWISVPIMSWYLVNLSMQCYYPTNGGGGGLGMWLGLVAGWLYMLIPFTVFSAVFLGVQAIVDKSKANNGK